MKEYDEFDYQCNSEISAIFSKHRKNNKRKLKKELKKQSLLFMMSNKKFKELYKANIEKKFPLGYWFLSEDFEYDFIESDNEPFK